MTCCFRPVFIAICALSMLLSSAIGAPISGESNYFIYEGNPVSAKYVAGRMIRLPVQDANDLDGLKNLEAVSALSRTRRLQRLSAHPMDVDVSVPRVPEYGEAMFDIIVNGHVLEKSRPPTLVWSGLTSFREVVLNPSRKLDARLKQKLVAQSREVLTPMLNLRTSERVGHRLRIVGPVSVRNYGRTEHAPHLAFVDITWRIDDLPESLASNGIDSSGSYLRVEYVVNSLTGKMVYRSVSNEGGIERRDMRLFRETDGPLLMATSVVCSDGSEPLILNLENESYGTGQASDVPETPHCFPAQ